MLCYSKSTYLTSKKLKGKTVSADLNDVPDPKEIVQTRGDSGDESTLSQLHSQIKIL
jgi:hypothetical protein